MSLLRSIKHERKCCNVLRVDVVAVTGAADAYDRISSEDRFYHIPRGDAENTNDIGPAIKYATFCCAKESRPAICPRSAPSQYLGFKTVPFSTRLPMNEEACKIFDHHMNNTSTLYGLHCSTVWIWSFSVFGIFRAWFRRSCGSW